MSSSVDHGLLALEGALGDGAATNELLGSLPRAEYNRDEQRLSVLVQCELDRMIAGGCDQLVLLKLYPRGDHLLAAANTEYRPRDVEQMDGGTQGDGAESERSALRVAWPVVNAGAVRHTTAVQLAADALHFFGPLHGGIVSQRPFSDVVVQKRQYTTAYPHINLERYDVYDNRTSEPVLGAWRARRIQNQRRETRTNRMIDVALLVLEVGQAVFPRLLG